MLEVWRSRGLEADSELVRSLIDEGYDAVRQRELRDALTANAEHQEEGVAEAALKILVSESRLV